MTFKELYEELCTKYKVARWDYVDKEVKVPAFTTVGAFELFDLIKGLEETYMPKIKMTCSQKVTFDLAMKNLRESSDIKSQEFVGNLYKELQRKSDSEEDYQFFLKLSGYQYAMILEHPELIEVSDSHMNKKDKVYYIRIMSGIGYLPEEQIYLRRNDNTYSYNLFYKDLMDINLYKFTLAELEKISNGRLARMCWFDDLQELSLVGSILGDYWINPIVELEEVGETDG